MGLKPRRETCPPEQILAGHSAEVVALANDARAMIQDMIEGVTEHGYPGWKLIGLRRRGYFGYIAPMADHIRIGFEYGYAVPNITGILQGDGQVRYIEIRDREFLHSRAVKTAISMALFDDDTHDFRSRANKP